MAVFNVLTTPQQIYQAVTGVFPDARVSMTLPADHRPVEMVITLSAEVEPFTLTTGVLKESFTDAIQKLYQRIRCERMAGMKPVGRLNIDRSVIQERLSNWQEFQRIIYQKDGRKCSDRVIAYLKGEVQEDQIATLGLAPHQVDGNASESDMAYFREIVEKLSNLSLQEKQQIRTNLKAKYPNIARRLLEELSKKNLEEGSGKSNDFEQMVQRLTKRVIGQEQAIRQLASILITQMSLVSKNQVFLFVGPSGVGKTELAKAVAEVKDNRFVVFHMNQFQNELDYNKFWGAGAGYVGSTDKPYLAKEIDKCKPSKLRSEGATNIYKVENAVILFDEFEKADAKIKQSLLTLFDEWICTISYTDDQQNVSVKYEFSNCVIINTSNLYQMEILESFQKNWEIDRIADLFRQLNIQSPKSTSYSPELLARTTVVPFGPIPKGAPYQSLIKMKLDAFFKELKNEFSFKELVIENESLVLSILENKLYGNGTNIRKIADFLLKIKPHLHQNKLKWGDLKKAKIIFYPDNGIFLLKIATYVEAFDEYTNIENSNVPLFMQGK